MFSIGSSSQLFLPVSTTGRGSTRHSTVFSTPYSACTWTQHQWENKHQAARRTRKALGRQPPSSYTCTISLLSFQPPVTRSLSAFFSCVLNRTNCYWTARIKHWKLLELSPQESFAWCQKHLSKKNPATVIYVLFAIWYLETAMTKQAESSIAQIK